MLLVQSLLDLRFSDVQTQVGIYVGGNEDSCKVRHFENHLAHLRGGSVGLEQRHLGERWGQSLNHITYSEYNKYAI